MWLSKRPGMTERPAKSMTLVSGPMSASASSPNARMRSRPLRVEGHDIAAPENEVGGDHGCVSWRICCSIMQTLFVSDEARKRIDDQLLACEEEQDNSKAGGVDHGRVRDDLRLQHEIAEAARDAKELGDKRDLP